MSNRQFALKSKISELMGLLETVRTNGVESITVHIDRDEPRIYSVQGLHDALETLTAEVISSTESSIAVLEERYEHDRADVFRIIGKLAEIVASSPRADNRHAAGGQTSTF